MSRAKKSDDKPREGATLSIDVDSFVRTRDKVSCIFLFFLHSFARLCILPSHALDAYPEIDRRIFRRRQPTTYPSFNRYILILSNSPPRCQQFISHIIAHLPPARDPVSPTSLTIDARVTRFIRHSSSQHLRARRTFVYDAFCHGPAAQAPKTRYREKLLF